MKIPFLSLKDVTALHGDEINAVLFFISLMWSTSSSSNSGTFMVEPIQTARDNG